MCSLFQVKRKIPFLATDYEISHDLNITWMLRAIAAGFREALEAPVHIRESWIRTSWIVEVTARGSCDDKPFLAFHLFLTSLRIIQESLLQLVRECSEIEGWHWILDTQLHEDTHWYGGNAAGGMATLRTAALNLLLLSGFRLIRAGF
jgi:hypothetical protein